MQSTSLHVHVRTALLASGLCLVGACETTGDDENAQRGETFDAAISVLDASSPLDAAGGALDAATSPPDAARGAMEGAAPSTEAAVEAGADAGATPVPEGACRTFNSSFEAIQSLVFERHGCTAAACHGQAKVGGLDLRAEVAWENLVDVASSNSTAKRVQPGAAADSFLYQKLRAATEPGSVQVAGSPMPIGAAALSDKELEAVKLWISRGAPKTGSVSEPTKGVDVGSLLDACLPPATPIKIKPLEPPAPAEGIQLRLPPYPLKAGAETEHCIPFVYDFTNQVPAQYKDEARNVIYTNGSRIRQDPQSHHLVVWNPKQDLSSVGENAAGWSCYGGPSDGKSCNPRRGGAECGDGVCGGKPVPGTFCNGDSSAVITGSGDITLDSVAAFLGLFLAGGGLPGQITSTQTPQQYTPPLPGVYTEIPLRGVFWFNSHAFNLTNADTLLEARVNFFYAEERKREMRLITNSSQVYIAQGTAPFTRKTFCAKHVVPQHYQIATLASHTHRRGERFWVNDASGKQMYESFDYSDPAYSRFEPWLAFDMADEAARTLEYCATFNNGLTKDDKPDLSLVTRASRMPERTTCTPVACVAGKVTAACSKDSDCDSAPGKGDGDCDACAITAGQTTENEMFALMPWYVLPPK